jgi:uncharacterized membrane protein YbhN (UPF0104 family)
MVGNKNIKKIIKIVLGSALFLWLSYSIYIQLKNQPDLYEVINELFTNWNSWKYSLLISVLLLMVLNWSIEAVKWKQLIQSAEQLSFIKAIQSVLTGVALSMLTPNRIGEYMGRILYLKNVNKIKGITVTIVGSFAQLIVTGGFGIIGVLYYLSCQAQHWWLWLLLISSIILFCIIFYIYFHLENLSIWLGKFSFLKKHLTYIEIVKRVDQSLLKKIILLSTCRYLIYTTQFYLLLVLFKVDGSFFPILLTLFLLFWVMAIVPSIAIAEVGVRGTTAIYFLSVFTSNAVGVLSATAMLWFVNLIIPALVGCLFVYRIKVFDEEAS